ncbi:histidine triad nucleotide-binding protein [Intrasporangium sp.]|uniref:histidine triad nucleotide-binding protein n=1 Tax=Intrasporangium sp. TaxID=1925024 RepID=UPI00293B5DA5|nr:histidine triad nucleotide-binding protein [Intrasporangium sp.]MDV3221894.1 histidine triad nucleotide-binding protein [Intrasporangium sp.]
MNATPQADDCLFCKIIAGEIPSDLVAENERAVAFRDINPAAPVHVLVVPKRHEPNIAALAAASPEDLSALFALVAEVVQQEGVAEHHRLLFNTGADAGQTIFHAHGHVLGGTTFTER